MSVKVSDFLLKENSYLFLSICLYVCLHEVMCTRREKHVGFPGTGVIIGCEQLVWILGAKPRSSTREINVFTR